MQQTDMFRNETYPSHPPVGRHIRAAVLVLTLGVGGFGLWSATAPLESAALAPGLVRVETQHRVVQHREGGIIRELLVHEGDVVRAGQTLLRLDDVATSASLQSLEEQRNALVAEEARLTAERDGLPEVHFPEELSASGDLLKVQRALFESNRAAFTSRQGMLEQRVSQIEAQIDAHKAQLSSVRHQHELITEELAAAETLVARGFEGKTKVLGLKRQQASLEGQRGELQARIAQAREAIASARLELANDRDEHQSKLNDALKELGTRMSQLDERLSPATDQQERRVIVAPCDGVVLNLRFTGVGGVIPAGGEVLDLVPTRDALTIDARLSPLDIDAVHLGLPARVRLSAYRQRVTPTVSGRVTRVAPDAVADPATGRPYYALQVTLEPEALARLGGDVALVPGMPVEVMVSTGAHTVLDYLLGPLTDSFARAFRES